MTATRSVLAFLLIVSIFPALAQQRVQRLLEWGGSAAQANIPGEGRNVQAAGEKVNAGRSPIALAFDGAFFDEDRGGLPYYNEQAELSSGVTGISAYLRDAVYVPLTSAERAAWPAVEEVGQEPEVHARVAFHRKRPLGLVSVYPYRRDPVSGSLDKLVTFRIELVEDRSATRGAGQRSYPDNSKLASGQWFRFTIAKDGVYRVTYENLRDMGADVSALSSDRINLYGNHFGLLPFVNNVERPTDLIVNAIQMVDGGDGVFGPGDHLLFYGTGPHRWEVQNERFVHTRNVYSDSASYFVGIDVEAPARVADAELTTDDATVTVNSFNDRHFINRELVNLLKSGRNWLGETFDLTTTYNYNFETPFLNSGSEATLVVNVAGRTYGLGNTSSFSITSGGSLSASLVVPGISQNNTSPVASAAQGVYTFNPTGSNVPVTLSFLKFDPITSVGWLNYLELNCRRQLRMTGDQVAFRDLVSVGAGQVAEMVMDQAQSVYRIWEVTTPTAVRNVAYTTDGSSKRFRVRTDGLREFIAFRDANYLTPIFIGRVPNQNLHATAMPADLVIVVPPVFQAAATRLAERRASEGMNVVIVSPQQVFNEFSSGARDATAIKRYMRMLYDRAGMDDALMPRHLLLFGDGSYNNLSLLPTNQNFIPSYQTADGISPSNSYTSDDYFGLLDETEGEGTGDLVDIGVGRLPVSSSQQAQEVVTKILAYDRLQMLSSSEDNCSAIGGGGIADWRNHVLFASDDQEGDVFEGVIHMEQSNQLAVRVENEHPQLNVDKIYLDAYQQVTTPGGERYPQANQDLQEKVQKGTLLVNYVGHGGEVGWAHERFLDNGTITNWSNLDRLPLFMTATCEFSRWDDPGRTSAGELVLLNPSGGGVGLMTTTRLAYSNQNFDLARRFYDHVFREEDDLGRPWQLGDTYRETKRSITAAQPSQRNHRNFSLLGDPSMRLAMPRERIVITAITDTLGAPMDTLKALATVRITGFVDDGTGQPMADFNGRVLPLVYDKESDQSTLANDGGGPFNFKIRKNIIYRGKATVTNGQFEFTFVVPKDINYQVGPGRISCYAESWSTNASGYTNTPLIGSTATDVVEDAQGPQIDLFMNDERFVRGGMTNENPLLFAKIFDDNGINTVGSSIGHDLLAVLDENTEQAVVLNDLYEADLDTYKSGSVRYRFGTLAEGSHTLRLKAWDAHNNSSDATTEFVVASSAELALDHVLNYPNPFTTRTSFFFEHNRPCTTLNVQVQVFTVSGRLIKTLSRQLACEGFRSEPLDWDGRDDVGDSIGRGVYVYRLSVVTPEGERAEKFEKLVVLR